MDVMMKTFNGITLVPLETRLLAERKIFIYEKITTKLACEFKQKLEFLLSEDRKKPINIDICSPGGEVLAGLIIIDLLKALETEVEINLYCTGMAASIAAIILASGKKNHRFITSHGKVLIHEPSIQGDIEGTATSIQATAESIMETKRVLVELLAKSTGKTIGEIEKSIAFDNMMDADKAIEFGICDVICDKI